MRCEAFGYRKAVTIVDCLLSGWSKEGSSARLAVIPAPVLPFINRAATTGWTDLYRPEVGGVSSYHFQTIRLCESSTLRLESAISIAANA